VSSGGDGGRGDYGAADGEVCVWVEFEEESIYVSAWAADDDDDC